MRLIIGIRYRKYHCTKKKNDQFFSGCAIYQNDRLGESQHPEQTE